MPKTGLTGSTFFSPTNYQIYEYYKIVTLNMSAKNYQKQF